MATLAQRPADRSVPRAALKSGDASRDGRGRIRAMPPILHYGFRPFFFLAALHAGLAVPLWLWVLLAGHDLGGPFGGLRWHAHEMLFGYLGAVMAGFILTAVPNWTGRLPLSGSRLLLLVGLWLGGRVAGLALPGPWVVMVVDLSFPAFLSFAVWREVIAGRNWKNAPVGVMLALFGIANALDHLSAQGLVADDLGHRLALAVVATLMTLIGGRIVPSFTRNWLVKEGMTDLPAPFAMLDKLALVATVAAAVSWVVLPASIAAGALLCLSGALVLARLSRWRGLATAREPILFVLHAGYAWLGIAIALLGIAALVPAVPQSAALHALTTGAVGTMTLAVMTRASLGHTGRFIVADRSMVAMYVMVSAGAVLRVAAPFADAAYGLVLGCGGALWSGAFLLFAIRFGPILFSRRAGA